MGQTIFYPGLNDFCRTYLVTNRHLTPDELVQYPARIKEEQGSIFEQLMLFDRICFKVFGENIPVPFLIDLFGQNAFEALIEQEAIGFALWTPVITYLVTEVPGIVPIQSGTQSSPAHSDPEQSIELGLNWMKDRPSLPARKRLIKQLVPLYEVPSAELSHDAVRITASAYKSGKLKALNFAGTDRAIEEIGVPERKALCQCATELLEYSYLIQHDMTSFSNGHYFSLFDESASKLQLQAKLATNFNRLARLEGFPDLKTDITKEYVDSIAESTGFFETKKGKITKSIVMTAIGAGIGAAVAGVEGALGGAVIGKAIETGAEFGLHLIDEFLISGIVKGWSPRMFFDDLGKFRTQMTAHIKPNG